MWPFPNFYLTFRIVWCIVGIHQYQWTNKVKQINREHIPYYILHLVRLGRSTVQASHLINWYYELLGRQARRKCYPYGHRVSAQLTFDIIFLQRNKWMMHFTVCLMQAIEKPNRFKIWSYMFVHSDAMVYVWCSLTSMISQQGFQEGSLHQVIFPMHNCRHRQLTTPTYSFPGMYRIHIYQVD